MSGGIAIYYDNMIIHWSSIMIVMGILSCVFIGLAIYGQKNKYINAYLLYIPFAIIISILLSRLLYWMCFREQFESLGSALMNYNIGGFLVPGVIIGCWVVAGIFRRIGLISSSFMILDALAPGMAFMIGIFKLSVKYSDVCRGKLMVKAALFQHLPFAEMCIDANGSSYYRLATYYITFILLMIITVVLLVANKKMKKKTSGDMFRLFLLLYGLVEVLMDSTRYDAAHITLEGKMFEGINKVSGFMGFGQLFGAITLIYVFVYYLVALIKKKGFKWINLLMILLFLTGFAIAGVAEYLTQRITTAIYQFYGMMIVGLIIIGISYAWVFVKAKKVTRKIEE